VFWDHAVCMVAALGLEDGVSEISVESQASGLEWRHSECDLENVPRALDRAVTRTEELEKFPKHRFR